MFLANGHADGLARSAALVRMSETLDVDSERRIAA